MPLAHCSFSKQEVINLMLIDRIQSMSDVGSVGCTQNQLHCLNPHVPQPNSLTETPSIQGD
jgi:hypothetical protein